MWKLAGFIVGLLIGVGGCAYGYDQYTKRRNELSYYEKELNRKEIQLTDLEKHLGTKNEQVILLVEEIKRLQKEIQIKKLTIGLN